MNQVPPSLDPFWLTEGTIVHSAVLENKADEITTTSKGKNAKKENNKRINSTKKQKPPKKAKLENTDISVSCEDYKTGITTSESTINSASPSVYDGEAVTKTEKPSTETVLKNPKNELEL